MEVKSIKEYTEGLQNTILAAVRQYEEDTGYRNGSQVTIVVDRIQGSLSYRGKKADG